MGWDAVIFDCDGVLVDSEPISCGILAEMLTEAGLPHTVEQAMERFVGRSMATCVQIIERELGRPMPTEMTEEFQRRTFEAFERELRPVAGVEEVLDWLPWAACIASSGDHAKLGTTLTATGLLPRFEGRVCSATEVARGKPHPDLFVHAARRMGAQPERCAVIEDSVLGVQAGRAAGMRVFGYSATFGAEKLEAAGAIAFHAMSELPGLLERFAPGDRVKRRAVLR
jgi:HAD superfamily hydrolase (TIGR01509 family)